MPPHDKTSTYRLRFRFRVVAFLDVEGTSITFSVGGREVRLRGQDPEIAIRNSNWLVASLGGFQSPEQARNWAERLRRATAIAAAGTRYAIDVGDDRATTAVSQILVDQLRAQGLTLHPQNVHGVDVLEDDDDIRVPLFNASIIVHSKPQPFLSDIERIFSGNLDKIDDKTYRAILLFDAALASAEPLARVVLMVAAVEWLAEQGSWSSLQKDALSAAKSVIAGSTTLEPPERDELSSAIDRLYPRSIRRAVRLFLEELGLASLWPQWDQLYSDRSGLVHEGKGRERVTQIADVATSLAGRIVLATINRAVPNLARLDAYPIAAD